MDGKQVKKGSVKEKLILSGIHEIEQNGIQNFSLRKAAADCGVSCAAPYKHFKDKQDFVLAIIEYINYQWHLIQVEVLKKHPDESYREKLTHVSLAYIRFLIDNPHFRSIIMLKEEGTEKSYIKHKAQLSLCTQELISNYCREVEMSDEDRIRKTFVVRSIIYGAALMVDNGELDDDETSFAFIKGAIEREFDLR